MGCRGHCVCVFPGLTNWSLTSFFFYLAITVEATKDCKNSKGTPIYLLPRFTNTSLGQVLRMYIRMRVHSYVK